MAVNAKADPNYVPKRINGKFAPGWSGNPGGSLEATRRSFNKDFLLALAADFKRHGPEAIAKVRKQQPAAYMKICALLVPREMKLEHSGGVKAMSDEALENAIEALERMLGAKGIEGVGEAARRAGCAGRQGHGCCGHRGGGEGAQAEEAQGAVTNGRLISRRGRRAVRRGVLRICRQQSGNRARAPGASNLDRSPNHADN